MSTTFEHQSLKFLDRHMDGSFRHIMSALVISRIEWWGSIECEYRPIAVMYEEDQDYESNLICLFPPFVSDDSRCSRFNRDLRLEV